MTTLTPLFRSPVSQVQVKRKVIEPLLDKTVTFLCVTTTHKQLSVTVRVEEIFRKFQAEINLGYAKVQLKDVHLAGSSLASVWSGKESSDIDIHGVHDLRGVQESQRFRETSNVEWILLQVILDTIKPYVPPEDFSKINKESFFYTKKVAFLNARNGAYSLPFNVLSLSIGTPPIEFSVWCLFEQYSGPPIRCHDFNVGALQLRSKVGHDVGAESSESDAYILSSSSGDVVQTLKEIDRGELTCDKPEELKDKSIPRYLSKVIRSGYSDLDPFLFGKLFSASVVRSSELEIPLTAELCINQLRLMFNQGSEDSPTYFMILLHLWFMTLDQGSFSEVKLLAKKELVRIFSNGKRPFHKEMHDLVLNDKRSELAWLLLCMCDTYKEINYRGEESLQLTFSFPSEEAHNRKLYLPLPMRGLARFKEATAPETFLSNEFTKVSSGRIPEDYLEGLFQIANKLFSNAKHFPILAALTRKFQLKKPEKYLALFLSWAASLPEQKQKEIPEEILKDALQGITEESSLDEQKDLLHILYVRFGSSEKILEWEKSALGSDSISLIVGKLFKLPEFSTLDSKTQEFCFSTAKTIIDKFFASEESASTLYAKDPAGCKRILFLVYKLYKSDRIPLATALRGMQFCTDCSLYDSSAKFLKEFWDRKESCYAELLPIAKNLAKADLSVYVKTLCSSKESLDREVRENFILEGIAALLQLEDPDMDAAKKLILESNRYLLFDDKVALASRLLEKSCYARFDSLFTYAFTEWKLSVASFSSFEKISIENLVLLEKQSDFDSVMHSNAKFAAAIIKRASELHLESIWTKGLKILARSDPLTCIELMKSVKFQSSMVQESISLCVDLWIAILEGIPEGQVHHVHQSLMEQLDIFQSYIDKHFHEDHIGLIDPVRKLHKVAVYFTLDSKFWPKIWAIVKRFKTSYRMISDWADLPDPKFCITHRCEKIPTMLDALVFDADSVIKWTEELLAEGKYPEAFASESLKAVLSSFKELDSKILKSSPSEFFPIARKVFEKIPPIESMRTFALRKSAADYALFCIAFGDPSIRSKVLDYYSNPLFIAGIIFSGSAYNLIPLKESDVALLALLRSWQSNNHAEIVAISETQFVWRSYHYNLAIAREICQQSTDFMQSMFQSKVEPSEEDKAKIFSSYFHFFYLQKLQIIERSKQMESVIESPLEFHDLDQLKAKENLQELSKTIDDSISVCLQHINRVKKISYLHPFIYHIQLAHQRLPEEVKDRIGKLFMETAVECIQADKKVEPNDIFYSRIEGIRNCIPLISGRSVSIKVKLRLMNLLIDTYSRYAEFERRLPVNPDSISMFFQALVLSLSNEELDDFFISWIQKIASEPKSLSEADLFLFFEFMQYKISKTGHQVFINNRFLILQVTKTMIQLPSLTPIQQKCTADFIHQLIPAMYSAINKLDVSVDIQKPFNLEMFSFCLVHFKHLPHSLMISSISAAIFFKFFAKKDSEPLSAIVGSERENIKKIVPVIENLKPETDFTNADFLQTISYIKRIFEVKQDSFRTHLSKKEFAFVENFFNAPYFT